MHKRFVILFAASALLLLACDASSLVTRFLPQKELADAQATIQALAPTAIAIATTGLPTQPASSSSGASTQSASTKSSAASTATKAPAQSSSSQSAASGPSGNLFTDAINKVKSATKYRIQLSIVVGSTENGKYQEAPLMDLTGELAGKNSHLISKGGLLAMLAKDENTPLEFIEADGKTYMKGVSMFGLTDPTLWYISNDSSMSGFADMANPDAYNDWTSGAKPGDFKKVRTESLDNQSCDVYTNDTKSLQNAGLLGLLGNAQSTEDFSAIDKAETSFWLCRDGYMHKLSLDYQGHNSKDATQKGAFKMTLHTWDYNNASITITPPKDAKPMPGQ